MARKQRALGYHGQHEGLEARAGQEEQAGGRRTLAAAAIRVVVQGRVGPDGTRPVIYDHVHERDAGTGVQFQPARVPVIFGGTLTTVIAEILVSLDRAGVGRAAGAPTEAEAKAAADDGWDW